MTKNGIKKPFIVEGSKRFVHYVQTFAIAKYTRKVPVFRWRRLLPITVSTQVELQSVWDRSMISVNFSQVQWEPLQQQFIRAMNSLKYKVLC